MLKSILKIAEKTTEEQKEKVGKKLIETGERLLLQTKKSKNKVYSIHEPHVYCVSKGKKNRPYEYGCKLSVVVSQKSGVVLSTTILTKNQYDGDSIDSSITHAEKMTETNIKEIYGDRGYRKRTDGKVGTKGTIEKGQLLYISGSKEAKKEPRKMRRRSLVEARISEIKRMGGGSKNYLHGIKGDKINGIMCGVGQNIRILIRHLSSKSVSHKRTA